MAVETIRLSTTDYLAVVLDQLLVGNTKLLGTPNQIHYAFSKAIEVAGATEIFSAVDFGPAGAPVFSHGLAAAISNLQSAGAIERTNPKLTTYERTADDQLSTYADDVKKALSSDQVKAIESVIDALQPSLASATESNEVFFN